MTNGAEHVPEPYGVTREEMTLADGWGLIRAIADRLQTSLMVPTDRGCLLFAGWLALRRSLTEFDAARGVGFATQVKHAVRGAMLDALPEAISGAGDLRALIRQLDALAEKPDKSQREPLGYGLQKTQSARS